MIWYGVVEDRKDPLKLGRCRVRILKHHTAIRGKLPTQHLPWAYPAQPITSAAMSGVGQTPLGPVEGTWVIGFFRDGEDAQQPVFFGTLGGIPEELANIGKGFNAPTDPRDKLGTKPRFPRKDHLNEPDTNRLARNENINNTIVWERNYLLDLDIAIANSSKTFSEPKSSYAAKYPYNHVFESESGHTFEVDDTEGAERLHREHKSGTFEEIRPDGSRVLKIEGNDYTIILKNNHVHIKGNAYVTIDGDLREFVKGNVNREISKNLTEVIGGNVKRQIGGNEEVSVGGKYAHLVAKKINIFGGGNILIEGASAIEVAAADDLTLQGKNVTTKTGGEYNIIGGSSFSPSGFKSNVDTSITSATGALNDLESSLPAMQTDGIAKTLKPISETPEFIESTGAKALEDSLGVEATKVIREKSPKAYKKIVSAAAKGDVGTLSAAITTVEKDLDTNISASIGSPIESAQAATNNYTSAVDNWTNDKISSVKHGDVDALVASGIDLKIAESAVSKYSDASINVTQTKIANATKSLREGLSPSLDGFVDDFDKGAADGLLSYRPDFGNELKGDMFSSVESAQASISAELGPLTQDITSKFGPDISALKNITNPIDDIKTKISQTKTQITSSINNTWDFAGSLDTHVTGLMHTHAGHTDFTRI